MTGTIKFRHYDATLAPAAVPQCPPGPVGHRADIHLFIILTIAAAIAVSSAPAPLLPITAGRQRAACIRAIRTSAGVFRVTLFLPSDPRNENVLVNLFLITTFCVPREALLPPPHNPHTAPSAAAFFERPTSPVLRSLRCHFFCFPSI